MKGNEPWQKPPSAPAVQAYFGYPITPQTELLE